MKGPGFTRLMHKRPRNAEWLTPEVKAADYQHSDFNLIMTNGVKHRLFSLCGDNTFHAAVQ